MRLSKLAIDTGYEAPAVYAWSRAAGYAQVTPIKGVESFNRSTPVSGPTFGDATIGDKRLRRGTRLWTIAVSTFKAETYRFLRLERTSDEDRALGVCDAAGTMHLPSWADTEWLKQLVAEQMATVRNKRIFATRNGRRCARGTRRWTAGCMPGLRRGSSVRIAWTRPLGGHWKAGLVWKPKNKLRPWRWNRPLRPPEPY